MRALILACALAGCVSTPTPGPTPDWEPLFDGKTLAGWVTAGGRYDGTANWQVADGAITGREGPDLTGGLIYTENHYRNFVFRCDEVETVEPEKDDGGQERDPLVSVSEGVTGANSESVVGGEARQIRLRLMRPSLPCSG